MPFETPKKKLLIIEDEPFLIDVYRRIFEDQGFRVFTATTDIQGFELAKSEVPDFILLDIILEEDSNGLRFLEKRIQDPELMKIPVLVFSNFDDLETQRHAFKLGILDYLIKTNYTPQQLIKKVGEYMEKIAVQNKIS